MPFRLGISEALQHLDPTLQVVTEDFKGAMDTTLFLVEEDAAWIGRRSRLLKPMFLTNENEVRRAIEYFKALASPGDPVHKPDCTVFDSKGS